MSVSVPPGETALFMCAGNGYALVWIINGQLQHVPASKECGAEVTYDNKYAYVGASVLSLKSNLAIPGNLENDKVSIQCALGFPSNFLYSPVVYLTVRGKLCIVNK